MGRYDTPDPNKPIWPRKSARVSLNANVQLRRAGKSHHQVKIFDLSANGCKAEFIERPMLDETVWVKFDQLSAIEAMVCWTRGFHVGLEFERPIYPAVFDMLLARLNGDSCTG